MKTLRKHLSSIIAVWLLCQVSALAVAPAALSAGGFFGAAGFVLCDCPDAEPGRSCPMHPAPAERSVDPDECVMQAACAPTDAAFLSLGLGAGILPPPPALASDAGSAIVTLTAIARDSVTELPDAPPPRA